MIIDPTPLPPFDGTCCDRDGDWYILRHRLTNVFYAKVHANNLPQGMSMTKDALRGFMYGWVASRRDPS
jgi:hypothetical protein